MVCVIPVGGRGDQKNDSEVILGTVMQILQFSDSMYTVWLVGVKQQRWPQISFSCLSHPPHMKSSLKSSARC